MEHTEKLYLQNTHLFHCRSTILHQGQDDRGNYVLLDRTVFYPQGGGQPSDEGVMEGEVRMRVLHVSHVHGEIRHYMDLDKDVGGSMVGMDVDCSVNPEKRRLHARYHSAAHLLSNVVEGLYPTLRALKGHSFPREAYMEFSEGAEGIVGDHGISDPSAKSHPTPLRGSSTPVQEHALSIDAHTLADALAQEIRKNSPTKVFEMDPRTFEQKFYALPHPVPENKTFRGVQMGDFPPIPCGGTHCVSTEEIGSIILGKIKNKRKLWRISYALG